MKDARAYLPNLCSVHPAFKAMCPTKALLEIANQNCVKAGFLKGVNKGTRFSNYLKQVTHIQINIAPYALRIGGRTWLLSKGLDRQLVDFFGNWKSPEASARYFRANPAAALKILRRFYGGLPIDDLLY